MLVTFIVFFAIIALLVLVHELGHFLAARRHGVKVEEFGFGFPPRLFGIKKGETLYSFNLLPFGGFVKIFGEDSSFSNDPRSFASRSIGQRVSILAAGVFFNLILAFLLFSVVIGIGMPVDANDPLLGARVRDPRITIVDVIPGSVAKQAGLEIGDALVELRASGDILRPTAIRDIQDFIKTHQAETVDIEVLRDDRALAFSVLLPGAEEPGRGILGIAMANIGILQEPWYRALWSGLEMTIATFAGTIRGLTTLVAMLLSGDSVKGLISGPVGIFSIVGSSIHFGTSFLIVLVAILSVNLALINLIPFPALDGGRLLFLAIEGVRGRAINQKVSNFAHALGFAILILLMIVITYYDVKLRL